MALLGEVWVIEPFLRDGGAVPVPAHAKPATVDTRQLAGSFDQSGTGIVYKPPAETVTSYVD